MTTKFEEERAIETYKSLIQISVAGLKLLALLNGGAAIALLAYLGNIAGKGLSIPDIRFSMGAYLVGLFLCGLAFAFSYLTQFRLYNEALGRAAPGIGKHQFWLWLTFIIALLSLVAFAVGSYCATLRLQ